MLFGRRNGDNIHKYGEQRSQSGEQHRGGVVVRERRGTGEGGGGAAGATPFLTNATPTKNGWIVNGKKINSQTLKLPSGKILKGEERKLFETKKIKLDVLKSEKIIGIN